MSEHPVDRLIRELIRMRREATPGEVGRILSRIRDAPFPTAVQHLEKRKQEDQWREEVPLRAYQDTLRRVVELADAHLAVYERRGGNVAAVLARTTDVVPQTDLGDQMKDFLYLVYSADRGIILSAYQASSLTRIALPGNVRWLK